MAKLVASGGMDVGEEADLACFIEGELFFAELGSAVGFVGVKDDFGECCEHGVCPFFE